MSALVRVSRTFVDDHRWRDLPTPAIVRSTTRHYWIRSDDPHMPELLADARHYADPLGPDCPSVAPLRRSAKSLVVAIQSAYGEAV